MTKMYMSIVDRTQYTGNRLGDLISSMLKNADGVAVFREHLIVITCIDSQYNLETYKIKEDDPSKETIEIFEGIINSTSAECYKDISYRMMTLFREIYTELKSVDFPVQEVKYWFPHDAFSYIYFD